MNEQDDHETQQMLQDIGFLQQRVAELDGEISRLYSLVYLLWDESPCRLDHHGACQEHGHIGWDGSPCPHAVAAAILPADIEDRRPVDMRAWMKAAEAAGGKTSVSD